MSNSRQDYKRKICEETQSAVKTNCVKLLKCKNEQSKKRPPFVSTVKKTYSPVKYLTNTVLPQEQNSNPKRITKATENILLMRKILFKKPKNINTKLIKEKKVNNGSSHKTAISERSKINIETTSHSHIEASSTYYNALTIKNFGEEQTTSSNMCISSTPYNELRNFVYLNILKEDIPTSDEDESVNNVGILRN